MSLKHGFGVVLGAVLLATTVGPARSQPTLRTLTEQEVVDLLTGSSIQAARSSDTEGMIRRAKELLAEGKRFTLIALEDLPDDWSVVSAAGGLGGGGAWDHVSERMERQRAPTISEDVATLRAMEVLAAHLGTKFDAIIRNEPSGGTLAAFVSATARGLPVVDACLAGRCKPEVQMQMPFVRGVPPKPAVLVTRWGETIIIDKAVDDYRLEDLGRAIAVASGGHVSLARTPLTGNEVKQGAIPDSLSQALLWGRTIREARERGKDPIAALVEVAHGYKLFHGVVTKAASKGERGHSYWDIELQGVAGYAGHIYKVWVKNENIISWLDGRVDVMPPDLLCDLDPQTGDAISGVPLGGYALGSAVVMVGIPITPLWRTPKGIAVFGPRHFGFALDYVPIEELQKSRPKLGGP
jgi:uncharacterized protein